MVEYKRYDRSYEDEVLKVFTASFVNYPLFWGVFEDRFKSETELRSFYERLMKGIFRATVRKDDCYIGIEDGKVKVIVIVEKPSDKPVGFWDYAVSGMAGIIARIGIRDTLRFMEMSDRTEIVVRSIPEPRWHLYFLAVDPGYQKRGMSVMLFNLYYDEIQIVIFRVQTTVGMNSRRKYQEIIVLDPLGRFF